MLWTCPGGPGVAPAMVEPSVVLSPPPQHVPDFLQESEVGEESSHCQSGQSLRGRPPLAGAHSPEHVTMD